MTTTRSGGAPPAPPPHVGEKRTHEEQQQQQQQLQHEQAAPAPPAAQKRARLPPATNHADAQVQEGGTPRGAEEKGEADTDMTAELEALKKEKKTRGGGKGTQTSQFHGVSFHKGANKWKAIHIGGGKQTYLGYYAKEEDAARAYIAFVKHGTRNVHKSRLGSTPPKLPSRKPFKKQGSSSSFYGVCWSNSSKRWVASLVGRTLGRFRNEKDAARRYNDEVRRLGVSVGRLNVIEGDDDGDDVNRGYHGDTEQGASLRSGATGTAAAADGTAATVAAPTSATAASDANNAADATAAAKAANATTATAAARAPTPASTAAAAAPPAQHATHDAINKQGTKPKKLQASKADKKEGTSTPKPIKPPAGKTSIKKKASRRACLNCQAQKTPQWRRGPEGPKTLCNACGVRYRKGHAL